MQMNFMSKVAKIQQIIPFILIIMLLAFVSYKNATKNETERGVCKVEKSEAEEEVKVKSALPIWESLSRHLIRVSR
jgi:ATP-dependent Zn protease